MNDGQDERTSRLLAAMGAVPGGAFEATQIQKLVFLAEERIGRTGFDFEPGPYGPVCNAVYEVLRTLGNEGMVARYEQVLGEGQPRRMRKRVWVLTPEGMHRAASVGTHEGIAELARWVLARDFSAIVGAVNAAYPSMATRTVFSDRKCAH